MDSTGVDRGPIPDYSGELCVYYILFVVLFSFFFLNTFVALIIVTFQEQGEKELSDCVLDKNQVRIRNITNIMNIEFYKY